MSIHSKIKTLRKAKGWSQQELANRVSELEGLAKPLTYSTVQQWELGESAPKRTRLPFVAQALGTTVDELMSDPQPGVKETPASYRVQVAPYPFRHIEPADLARLSETALDQLERVVAAFIGSAANIPSWRPIALSLAADLDRERGDDRLINFVRAVDIEIERQAGRLKQPRASETTHDQR